MAEKSGTSASKKAESAQGSEAAAPASKRTSARTPGKAAGKKATTAKKTSAKKTSAKTTSAKTTSAKKSTAKKSTTTKTTTSKTSSRSSKPAARKSRKQTGYGVGDRVVHPHHGAATITKKTRQVVDGTRKDYFELEIATDQLTVYVPVDKIDVAIRPVISQNQARKVFSLFKEEPQEAGANWSRWYKVLNEKMTSGDIYQVAEVVRDLTYAQQTKGISPALKRMLSRARLTLTSELQFALDISEDDAVKRLDRALPKVEVSESE